MTVPDASQNTDLASPSSSTTRTTGMWATVRHWMDERRVQRRLRATHRLWQAMAVFRRDKDRPYDALPLNPSEAQKALAIARWAIGHGADVHAPQGLQYSRTDASNRTLLRSMPAMAPLEWALSNQAWSLAEVLLDGGVDPWTLGQQPQIWHHWSADNPDGVQVSPTQAPLWVLAVLSAHRSLGVHDSNHTTHGTPWPLLERMVPHGDAADWADAAGFPLACQMISQSFDHPLWSVDWWKRLQGHRADPLGRNALHHLAQRPWLYEKEEEAFGRLIDAGADPYLIDANGESPLSMLTKTPAQEHSLLLLLDALDDSHPDLLWETPNAWGEQPLDQLLQRTWTGPHGLPTVVERMQARAVARAQHALSEALTDVAPPRPETGEPLATMSGTPSPSRVGRRRL